MVTLNRRPRPDLLLVVLLAVAAAPALAVQPRAAAASVPASAAAGGNKEKVKEKEKEKATQLVDLNHASQAALLGLNGINAQRADAIIRGRHYTTTDELVSRRILPNSVYVNIRDRLTVTPPKPGAAASAGSAKPS